MVRLTTIRLYGPLGVKFGRVHRFAVGTAKEAIKALCVNFDGFEAYLMDAQKNGMTFSVFRGKHNLSEDAFKDMGGIQDIRIAPILIGSKKAGAFQTILGAVLVVAGVVISVMSSGTMSAFGAQMALAGGMMMAGGIYQMLSPQAQGLKDRQDPDNRPSYAFGGAVNTVAMGNPVPVLYGERIQGGALISAGIWAEDQ